MTTSWSFDMQHRFEGNRWLAAWITLCLALPVAVEAQESPSGAEQIRISCEQARQTLSSGGSRPEKIKSIVTMQQCGDVGAETLVSYWRQAGADTALLPALTAASARMNDRRTYQAARAVVLDPSRSEEARLAALTVLVAGFNPKIAVSFNTPTKPMHSTYVGIGVAPHASTRKGPQPIGPEAKSDLLNLLKQLAASDPNERIRKVAGELGPLLQRRT
jgi:hypothetical protein